MSETSRIPVDPTPCLIGRAAMADGSLRVGRGRVVVHSRTDPCGYPFRDGAEPVPTFVKLVEEWLEDSPISPRACKHCGGSL